MIFRSKAGSFSKLLWREAPAGSRRFSARNFLLDEGFPESRADSYLASHAAHLALEGEEELSSAADWSAAHYHYLQQQILLRRKPGVSAPQELNPNDPELCPETFRSDFALASFGGADPGLDLLRMVDLKSLMVVAKKVLTSTEDQVYEAGQRIVLAHQQKNEPAEADVLILQAVLDAWNQKADLRPTFVGFLAEHEDLFVEDGSPWADGLRDRLGLHHYGPQRMLLFRYPVGRVPRLGSWRLPRPLAVPTVLDGQLNEAFCPAPRGSDCGRLVNLSGADREPAREVLHPYLDLDLTYLYRVGEIQTEPCEDLAPARKGHIGWLRQNHSDFAHDTDP